jgi:Putative Actinobacterial Holin-X, holin superfamily III
MLSTVRQRKSLSNLLRQLAGDGVRVAEAELAQARSELGDVIRRQLIGIAMGVSGIAVMMVTITILAQSAAIALTPYVSSPAYAYLNVGLILAVMTISLFILAYRCLMKKRKPVGLIFKWFADVTKSKASEP